MARTASFGRLCPSGQPLRRLSRARRTIDASRIGGGVSRQLGGARLRVGGRDPADDDAAARLHRGAAGRVRALRGDHHVITGHVIEVDGDRATVHAHVRAEHWGRWPSGRAGRCWSGWPPSPPWRRWSARASRAAREIVVTSLERRPQ
ncbi:nuclear transport factor 2 family protein [Paractinoplanes deccanensis]|uniref:nuclear transport factor 2 family protein n=1 Tax=Paractinoplanes deccanensis TaxID=113561 RepID=UPI0019443A58